MSQKISRRSFIKDTTALGATALLGGGLLAGQRLHAGERVDVSVAVGRDYFKNTLKAVEQLGGMKRFVPRDSRVAILANVQRNNPGTFTKPGLVKAVIHMCKEAGAKELNFLSWLPVDYWEKAGLKAVIEAGGARLVCVDLKDENQFKPVPVPGGVALKEARVMKAFFDNDVFINMPITKDHAGNKFTGTLKNLMGLNSPKNNRTFHKKGWKTEKSSIVHLDQCIADLNLVIEPDLNIVDATEFITSNGPFGPGELIKPQKVVAGIDRVAVDSYCCTLWGLKPKDIIMIEKAYLHKLGEMNPARVKVKEIPV